MNTIKIKGMSCGHCQKAVKNLLEDIKGVKQVSVSLEDDNASFVLTENTSIEDVLKRINETHYEASL
ncbi:MAG: heavy-metal-associated domain-containing protein [Chitinophagales bacterium]